MKTLSLSLNPSRKFYIPARSSFILGTFPSIGFTLGQYTKTTSQFDVIVIDPPWANRSVSRLKKKNHLSYETIRDICIQLPYLAKWLSPGGIVAVWATNSISSFSGVLDAFDKWNLELVGQWVWLKVSKYLFHTVDN
jgi:N6-adenosine-specific RNA methylase IME4